MKYLATLCQSEKPGFFSLDSPQGDIVEAGRIVEVQTGPHWLECRIERREAVYLHENGLLAGLVAVPTDRRGFLGLCVGMKLKVEDVL